MLCYVLIPQALLAFPDLTCWCLPILLQTRLKEVEERMAQSAAEVELLRISR
jgi:hypothetical protein